MLLELVEAQLQSSITGRISIDTALQIAEVASKKPQRSVSLFLVPLGDRVTNQGRTTGPILDQVTTTFAVVFAIRHMAGRAELKHATLDEWRKKVRDALNGWTPGLPTYTPLLRGNGQIVALRDHTLWWQDQYRTTFLEESAYA